MKDMIEIRAHHGMCLSYFEGKGYSNDFVSHMSDIQKELEKNPKVRIKNRTDEICRCCPNKKEDICETEEKVNAYDNQVMDLCGLKLGEEMNWNFFRLLVEEKILHANKREEICGDCQWNSICGHC